tara:strand:+ start:1498 stop:1947 length:450 start_codon:yes stop_codon:yes gene_type:complete
MGKLVLIFGAMLVIALVFSSLGLLSDTLEENYIDTGISSAKPDNSTWAEDFDVVEDVASNMTWITGALEQESDEENEWLDSLFRGGMLVIGGLVLVPLLVITAMGSVQSLLITGGTLLGLPPFITLIGFTGIAVWVAFRVIAFGRRFEA